MERTVYAQTMTVRGAQTMAGWCVTIWAHSTSLHVLMH